MCIIIVTQHQIPKHLHAATNATEHGQNNNKNDDDEFIIIYDEYSSKYSELNLFLENEVNFTGDDLKKYLILFIKNGFEDVSSIKILTDKDLIKMGVDKLGHRKKILYALNK